MVQQCYEKKCIGSYNDNQGYKNKFEMKDNTIMWLHDQIRGKTEKYSISVTSCKPTTTSKTNLG